VIGGFNTSFKKISQLGLLFPIHGKKQIMFQTTNKCGKFQGYVAIPYPGWSLIHLQRLARFGAMKSKNLVVSEVIGVPHSNS
jgi:hypothetical protein